MSADTELILEKLNRLSLDELLLVKAKIDEKIQQGETLINNLKTVQSATNPRPQIYTRTKEEVEAFLSSVFTPEERAEIGKTDFSKVQLQGKSLSEMINEDREDRF